MIINPENPRFSATNWPLAFCRYARSSGTIGLQNLTDSSPNDVWDDLTGEPSAEENIPGLAARAFGLDRFTYDDTSGIYHETSTGYFDRPIINADEWISGGRQSVIHTQQANHDNLFMGYWLDSVTGVRYKQIDIFQIAP